MNKRISIIKISRELKLNPSTIVSIENGRHNASFVNVYKILIYLKINRTLFLEFLSNELTIKNHDHLL